MLVLCSVDDAAHDVPLDLLVLLQASNLLSSTCGEAGRLWAANAKAKLFVSDVVVGGWLWTTLVWWVFWQSKR
jgi:hypothetical protein